MAILSALLSVTDMRADDFIAGADCSHLGFFERHGIVYKDGGNRKDAFEILKQGGLTCARLRVFTSNATQAAADPYNFGNTLEDTLSLAVRAKAAGLRLLLDFHYSDSWADPGKQTKPASWSHLTFPQLEQRMRSYSSNCISEFRAAGASPDYAQVGNEIIGGLLWPDGRVGGVYDTPQQWSQLGRLLSAAVRGIHDASEGAPPQIIIHIDRGGDWSGTRWFFDNLAQQPVAFDIIGESYYAWWHGDLADLSHCLTNTAQRYAKPVLIVETAFPWTNSTPVLNLPATPAGQIAYVATIAKVVRKLPAGMGRGIVWWGAEYVGTPGYNLAGFEGRSFFDAGANALPVVKAMGQLSAPLRIDATLNDQDLTLMWPFSGAGLSCVTSTGLAASSVWLPVTNNIQITNAMFDVSLPRDANHRRFFRLQGE
ncbi:MAG: glycosyl hydrolase 53 family protein [Verrucomicrobia bacterium]|nr:glycosyl hydrolase 53 family protein [Verrucomicrobiota bacterium]MBI3871091.1 glycosyl hydrolase 53 family protein [Verrucomicrobiota bacterium]